MTRSSARVDRTLRVLEAPRPGAAPPPPAQDFWQSFPPQLAQELEFPSERIALLPFQLAGRMTVRSLVTLARASTATTVVAWAIYVLEGTAPANASSETDVAGRARWRLVRPLGAMGIAVAGAHARYSLWLEEGVTLEPGVIYGLALHPDTTGAGAALLIRPDMGAGGFTLLECESGGVAVGDFPTEIFPTLGPGYSPPFHVILRSLRGVQAFGVPGLG